MNFFFKQVSNIASQLNTKDEMLKEGTATFLLPRDAHEDALRLLERSEYTEEELHALILKERESKGSTASRFLAEAYPVGEGHGNSQASASPLSEHDSDRNFVKSQGSSFDEKLHPRYALAKSEVRQGNYIDKQPEVVTLMKVKDLPPGFCPKGHKIEFCPRPPKKGHRFQCACCKQLSDVNIFTCHCSTYFVCSRCLLDCKASPPPPPCPNPECIGTCTLRHKALITICYEGEHDIPREQPFWMCKVKSCQANICCACAQAKTDKATSQEQYVTPQIKAVDVAAVHEQHNPDSQQKDKFAQAAVINSAVLQCQNAAASDFVVASKQQDNIAAKVQQFLNSLESPEARVQPNPAEVLPNASAAVVQAFTIANDPPTSSPHSCSPILTSRAPGFTAPMRKDNGQ
jgi:hypothetical protein